MSTPVDALFFVNFATVLNKYLGLCLFCSKTFVFVCLFCFYRCLKTAIKRQIIVTVEEMQHIIIVLVDGEKCDSLLLIFQFIMPTSQI